MRRLTLLSLLLLFTGFSAKAQKKISSSITPWQYYDGYYVNTGGDTIKNVRFCFDPPIVKQQGCMTTYTFIAVADKDLKKLYAYDVKYLYAVSSHDTFRYRCIMAEWLWGGKENVFAREHISGLLSLLTVRGKKGRSNQLLLKDGEMRYPTKAGLASMVQDCPEALAMVNEKWRTGQLEKIIRFYNQWYIDSHRL